MPHSPYTTTIYQPISNPDSYRRALAGFRAQEDDGCRLDTDEILGDYENLIKQWEFLDDKLIKVCSCFLFQWPLRPYSVSIGY